MKPASLEQRGLAVFMQAARAFRLRGRVQPMVMFDLMDAKGNKERAIFDNQVSETKESQDELDKLIREKCNSPLGNSLVYAVYTINVAWTNSKEMTELEMKRAMKKYGGGPGKWPIHMRDECLLVTAQQRNGNLSISGAISRIDNTVDKPQVSPGPEGGRFSKYFNQQN